MDLHSEVSFISRCNRPKLYQSSVSAEQWQSLVRRKAEVLLAESVQKKCWRSIWKVFLMLRREKSCWRTVSERGLVALVFHLMILNEILHKAGIINARRLWHSAISVRTTKSSSINSQQLSIKQTFAFELKELLLWSEKEARQITVEVS